MSNQLKEVESVLNHLFKQSIINFVKKDPERKNIHVSDLTGDCMRQPWYRLHSHTPMERTYSESVPLAHGTALHSISDLGGINEIKLAGNIFKMKAVRYDSRKRPLNFNEVVQGSIDDIIDIDGELIIADKKTTRDSIPKEAPMKYKLQMNIYKLLYFINKKVEIKKAGLIYIDKSSGWKRYKSIVFDLLPIDEIKDYVIDKLKILSQKDPPERVETYLCNFCPFRKECLGKD